MRLEEILILIYQHWELYGLSLIINITVCYIFFKRYIHSLLDPLFFRVVGVSFANTIPLFMWMCGAIKIEYFIIFLILEISFWIGFSLNKPQKKFSIDRAALNKSGFYALFIYAAFFIILFRLYFYLFHGIPLLMENRADKYIEAQGLGVLDRLTYILEFYCLIYSFAHVKARHWKLRLLSRLYLVIFAVFCVLEGAKGAFISVLGPLFFYVYYIRETSFNKKQIMLLLFLVIGIAILVMIVQGSTQDTVVVSLLTRFMMFGDVYYEGFGNNAVEVIKISHPITDLFINFLAPFRLMEYSTGADVPPTMQIHWFVYPELGEINGGPNNRVPFLYYCLFGPFIGACMSFITGFLVSFSMYRIVKSFRNNILSLSIYASIYTIACSCITDPLMAISALPSIVFGYFFLVFIYLTAKSSVKI